MLIIVLIIVVYLYDDRDKNLEKLDLIKFVLPDTPLVQV